MAYIQKNNPFKKTRNPVTPEESMTDKVHELDEAEVVTYTGTKREQKKKRRQHEGVGANFKRFMGKWSGWKDKRNEKDQNAINPQGLVANTIQSLDEQRNVGEKLHDALKPKTLQEKLVRQRNK